MLMILSFLLLFVSNVSCSSNDVNLVLDQSQLHVQRWFEQQNTASDGVVNPMSSRPCVQLSQAQKRRQRRFMLAQQNAESLVPIQKHSEILQENSFVQWHMAHRDKPLPVAVVQKLIDDRKDHQLSDLILMQLPSYMRRQLPAYLEKHVKEIRAQLVALAQEKKLRDLSE